MSPNRKDLSCHGPERNISDVTVTININSHGNACFILHLFELSPNIFQSNDNGNVACLCSFTTAAATDNASHCGLNKRHQGVIFGSLNVVHLCACGASEEISSVKN